MKMYQRDGRLYPTTQKKKRTVISTLFVFVLEIGAAMIAGSGVLWSWEFSTFQTMVHTLVI